MAFSAMSIWSACRGNGYYQSTKVTSSAGPAPSLENSPIELEYYDVMGCVLKIS